MTNRFSSLNVHNLPNPSEIKMSIFSGITENFFSNVNFSDNFILGSGIIISLTLAGSIIYYLNQPNSEDLNEAQEGDNAPSVASYDTIKNNDPIGVYTNKPETYEDPFNSTLIPQPSIGYFSSLADYFKAVFKSNEVTTIPKSLTTKVDVGVNTDSILSSTDNIPSNEIIRNSLSLRADNLDSFSPEGSPSSSSILS